MRRDKIRLLSYGVFALALVALPLSGCSSTKFGSSSFGGAPQNVAEIPNIASYTAEGALTEARGHFGNNDYGYSAALYKRAVELSPQNPEGYIGLSASYDRLGRFDLSDRVYAALYKLSGGTAQYYNNVGYSYMLRGNLPAALTNFRRASKLAPDNVIISNNMQLLASATTRA